MDPKKNTADLGETVLKAQESGVKDAAIDAALNKKGFAEFVALYDDHEKILEGGPRTSEVIKVFEKKDALRESAHKILTEQIGKELGKEQGLELTAEDMGGVDEFLAKMAVEDTEGFLKLAEKSEKFQADTTEVKALEERLKALGMDVNKGVEANDIGSTRESLLEKKYVLNSVKNTDYASRTLQIVGSFLTGSKAKNAVMGANRDAALNKYGMETNWYGKIQDVDKQIEITKGLIELQDLRRSLIGDVFPNEVLGPVIQSKVSKYLSDLSLSTKLEELEKAQSFLERAQLASEKGDTGVDYLGAIDENKTQENIDAGLSAVIGAKVNEVIAQSTLGNNALSRLEKSLKEFIARETLGSKDKEEYRDFLVKHLEEQVASLSADHESKAKAVLIKRIIIKLNNA